MTDTNSSNNNTLISTSNDIQMNDSNINNNNNINNSITLEDPMKLFIDLNSDIEKLLQLLTAKTEKENQVFINQSINDKVDKLIDSSKEMESYFINLEKKYINQKKKIELKQELCKLKKEVENKDRLIEKYKNKVKEWKQHFEPLYHSQNEILHSSGQVLSSDINNPFSPIPPTPMPSTPNILSTLSQPTPSPSMGLNSTIL
ncbi:hypothetical protein CYY_004233 [Polysphondylium violaceum]|uniref:Mediator complex subunit 28 n=1 Tax=Polysphondylium violaceum TaxID=133409 RepID=A0A8J4PVQ8_9MYCE|nr:hypothetical protein CYY_004233 [Polysphondylium violaceum]